MYEFISAIDQRVAFVYVHKWKKAAL